MRQVRLYEVGNVGKVFLKEVISKWMACRFEQSASETEDHNDCLSTAIPGEQSRTERCYTERDIERECWRLHFNRACYSSRHCLWSNQYKERENRVGKYTAIETKLSPTYC
jgi:hypothetical protein